MAIESGTGDVYSISPSNRTIELLGTTSVTNPVGFSTAPTGTTYLLSRTTLFHFDPETLVASEIGALGVALFEGALAVTDDGRAFASNGFTASSPRLYEVDLELGDATLIGTISPGSHDVNGLVWRDDGRLVGLDRESNALIVIDPNDASVDEVIALAPTVGSVGGMTQRNGIGYLNTSGPVGSAPGSNALYQVNLYDGTSTALVEFEGVIDSTGLSGLTRGPSPEPSIYCTAKTNSLGCLPAMESSGLPSASNASGFVVSATQVRNNKLGVGCYSISGVDVVPFQGGLLCMRAPVLRTPAVVSGGSPPPANDCSGVYSVDMNAFAAGQIGGAPAAELTVPGTQVQFQFWGRDKPASQGSSLSDALGYTVGI